MPYHSKPSGYKNVKTSEMKKPKEKKEKPMDKPHKNLTMLQKEFMKEHSKKHSPEHNKEMIKLMKKGFCIQQSHKMAMKKIGK